MKCIYCNTDTPYPQRTANHGRCRACRHPFAFEPKTLTAGRRSVTDGFFHRTLQEVSLLDSVAFTEKQLYYEFSRRLWNREGLQFTGRGCLAGLALLGVTVVLSFVLQGPVFVLGVVGAVVLSVLVSKWERRHAPRRPPLSFDDFRARFLKRWEQVHGRPERLALPPGEQPALPRREPDAELAAFSFDRALVTDSAELAAMLVANNFHFENNCAILSSDGYPPPPLRETVLGMLRRNPRLTVFAIHDASPSGCELPLRLRGPEWFPDPSVRIIDLGLRPRHVRETKLMTLETAPVALPAAVREILAPEEAAWLEAGNVAELAAFRPERLMRAIYQGFARAGQLAPDAVGAGAGGGDTGVLYPGFIWLHDGGADLAAADSFG
jgi:hypothetical protein